MILSPHEIAHVAAQAGFTGVDLINAVAVALAESSGDTDAIGRSTIGENLGQRDHGLWQISGRWHPEKLREGNPYGHWRDPYVNARLAHAVWTAAKKSWTPWKVWGSKAYEKWLPDARFGAAAPMAPPPSDHLQRELLLNELRRFMALIEGRERDDIALRVGIDELQNTLNEIRRHFT